MKREGLLRGKKEARGSIERERRSARVYREGMRKPKGEERNKEGMTSEERKEEGDKGDRGRVRGGARRL